MTSYRDTEWIVPHWKRGLPPCPLSAETSKPKPRLSGSITSTPQLPRSTQPSGDHLPLEQTTAVCIRHLKSLAAPEQTDLLSVQQQLLHISHALETALQSMSNTEQESLS